MDIKIPNLGDIDEVEVIEITVAVGDEVGPQDTLIVIESDKASMDVPAETTGTITALHVSIGDMVSEGAVIASIDAVADDQAQADSGGQTKEANDEPVAEPVVEREALAESAVDPQQTQNETGDGASQELDVLVPDIGDAKGVVVIEIAAKAGDQVALNDLIVVLESDKASMEIAADHAGEIIEILVNEDQEVEEGTVIARMRVSSAGQELTKQDLAKQDLAKQDLTKKDEAESNSTKPKDDQPSTAQTMGANHDAAEAETAKPDAIATGSSQVYAGPATRRLARELGVDLNHVNGTGSRNRIVKDDVKAHVKEQLMSGGGSASTSWPLVPAVDFTRFGEIEEIELSRIRQRGADNLHKSWVNLPHVTQHNEVDITELEEFRRELKTEAERKGIKLTPLAFIIKAVVRTLQEFPEFNSSLHEDHKRLIVKKYINIGMAVDTPQGLVVPVIRSADQLDVWQLSDQIIELSNKARDKKLALDDLQGGTFSVSSLGALGGTGFTPIVNAPEVAILGVAALQTKPLWDGSSFQPRKVLPLSLSYDHRVINGADGGRYMNRLCELLADIRLLAL